MGKRERIIRQQEGRRHPSADALRLIGGPVVPVPDRAYGSEPPLVPGQHAWIMMVSYKIQNPESAWDPGVPKFLDLENLLSVTGPGCYWCEQEYTDAIAAKPCPGDASA